MLTEPGTGIAGSTDSDRTFRTVFAASGFATGVLVLLAFVAEGMTPNVPSPTQANFVLSQAAQNALTFRSLAWGSFAISGVLFFALLGRVLRPRSPGIASAATLLTVIGITVYALRGIIQDAGWEFLGTTAAPSPTQAAYLYNLVYAFANPLEPLGAAMWGLGFIVFGALIWRSAIFPSWLAFVAFVGGVAGWAIFAVINSYGQFIGYLFTELLLPFTTAFLCFTCGVVFLLRSRAAEPTESQAVSANK